MSAGPAAAATILAALVCGCGTSGATPPPPPTPPPAAPEATVWAPGSVPADPAATVPAPARRAGHAVARAATRRLYARARARVSVPGATREVLRELDRFPMPRYLRGSPARAEAVEVVLESPTRAVLWWVLVDSQTRTPLALALERRSGSWRVTGMLAD